MNSKRIFMLICCLILLPFVVGPRCGGGTIIQPLELGIETAEQGEVEQRAFPRIGPLPVPPPPGEGEVEEDTPPPKKTVDQVFCEELQKEEEPKPDVIRPTKGECPICNRLLPLNADAVFSIHWEALYQQEGDQPSLFVKSLGDEKANDLVVGYAEFENEGVPLVGVGLNQIDVMCAMCMVRQWGREGSSAMQDIASGESQTSYGGGAGGTDLPGGDTAMRDVGEGEEGDNDGDPFDMCGQFAFIIMVEDKTVLPDDTSLRGYVTEHMPEWLAEPTAGGPGDDVLAGKLVAEGSFLKQYHEEYNQWLYFGFVHREDVNMLVVGTKEPFDYIVKTAAVAELEDRCPFRDMNAGLSRADATLAFNNNAMKKLLEEDDDEDREEFMQGETDVEKEEKDVEFIDLFRPDSWDHAIVGLDVTNTLMMVLRIYGPERELSLRAMFEVNPDSLDFNVLPNLFDDDEKVDGQDLVPQEEGAKPGEPVGGSEGLKPPESFEGGGEQVPRVPRDEGGDRVFPRPL